MRPKSNAMERKIKLKTVNQQITCYLCKGYLIDATTITECLHTFCKSCIVQFLTKNNTCPKCKLVIHQSHPKNYISHDRTMQDIVYKLVPGLQEDELERQRDFYEEQGLEMPSSLQNDGVEPIAPPPAPEPPVNNTYHRNDEQVNLCLEGTANKIKQLHRKYLRCSSQATIQHIKKFIASKIFNNVEKFKDVDILFNEDILGKDHTLKFIFFTRWPHKDAPLTLNYRPKLSL